MRACERVVGKSIAQHPGDEVMDVLGSIGDHRCAAPSDVNARPRDNLFHYLTRRELDRDSDRGSLSDRVRVTGHSAGFRDGPGRAARYLSDEAC